MNPRSVETCVRCDQRPQVCNGPCACTVSGEDVTVHLTKSGCPLKRFDAPGPDDTPARSVMRGAIGIAKAVARIDRAPTPVIARRRATCKQCPHSTNVWGVLKMCAVCGCGLSAKTAVGSEKCPIGKWNAVTPGST